MVRWIIKFYALELQSHFIQKCGTCGYEFINLPWGGLATVHLFLGNNVSTRNLGAAMMCYFIIVCVLFGV